MLCDHATPPTHEAVSDTILCVQQREAQASDEGGGRPKCCNGFREKTICDKEATMARRRGGVGFSVAGALMLLVGLASAAPPTVDSAHSLMEPAQPKPRSPRLKSPYGGNFGQDGMIISLSRLVTPKRTLMMLPAVCVGMAAVCPDVLARVLMQLICYFGSLFEPFDGLLPQHGLLRTLVNTVKDAKRAYNVKHGIPSIDDAQFFDDDDDDDDEVQAKDDDSSSSDATDDAEPEEDDEGDAAAAEKEDIYT